uniref:Nuclear receptor coactivator 7 n=1 Tax=Oreochromis niloticus TaxID=8128 RepID=A0A669DFI6_ORENI
MEKRDRKPGYFARLKRRKQLRGSQSEKTVNEQNPEIISCPDIPNDGDANKQAERQRATGKPDDGCKVTNKAKMEKTRPPGTVEFIVGRDDSLNSIALKFNITPNKLVQLNKLFSRSVYPGQVRKLSATALRRELSPNSEDESPLTVKFIKMSCKYFTDGMGVVGGVLIVTPNNIMFDPHKSDPLVIEHGCEEYGLICPMGEVVSVALYDDVSRMKLKDALPSDLPQDLCPVYRPGEWEQLPSEQELNPFSRYEALDPKRPIVLDDIESTLSETDEGFTELEPTVNGSTDEAEGTSWRTLNRDQHELLGQSPGQGDHKNQTQGKLDDEEDEGVAQNTSIEDGESMSGPDRPAEEDELSEEERQKKTYELEMKSWLLKRMQAPIEDMLFSSEEKSKNPPMFLCFKVGKPMRKSFATCMTSSPAHSLGGREKQPEYWFAVPQERVDDLYAFFVQWSPDVYGKEAREQGFVVVEKDELDMIDNFFSDPASCSWEIITLDEAKRRQSFGSIDGDFSMDALPMLIDTSDLLQDTHIEKLACRLPPRVQGYPWRLAYSTEKHGTSLKTLYRNLADVDSPVLLVIKDMDNQIFGAFSTHPFRVSEHCYGTGETFLYSFCPEIKVFRWTGENSYFVKGNIDSLQMGGGGGQLGLWLDAELYRGTTTKCATFNNQPLSSQQDFNIHSLEVWTFE